MDFGKALKFLKNNEKTKRHNWEDGVYLIIEDGNIVQHNGIYVSKWEYTNSCEDVLAEDWEVVKDENKKAEVKIDNVISETKTNMSITDTIVQLSQQANSKTQKQLDENTNDIKLLFDRMNNIESAICCQHLDKEVAVCGELKKDPLKKLKNWLQIQIYSWERQSNESLTQRDYRAANSYRYNKELFESVFNKLVELEKEHEQ